MFYASFFIITYFLRCKALYESPPFPRLPISQLFRPSLVDKEFVNIWAIDHQEVSEDASSITLRLDNYSGHHNKKHKLTLLSINVIQAMLRV